MNSLPFPGSKSSGNAADRLSKTVASGTRLARDSGVGTVGWSVHTFQRKRDLNGWGTEMHRARVSDDWRGGRRSTDLLVDKKILENGSW
jgi:hypothetical protein